VSSLSGGLSQQIPHSPVPSLGAFASIPGPTIPAELLVDSNPELLADWLTAAIAQLDSSKSVSYINSFSHLALRYGFQSHWSKSKSSSSL
jgi:hypothetical protein